MCIVHIHWSTFEHCACAAIGTATHAKPSSIFNVFAFGQYYKLKGLANRAHWAILVCIYIQALRNGDAMKVYAT